jgi:hypothetical protein
MYGALCKLCNFCKVQCYGWAAGVVEWNSGLEMQGAGNEPLLLCGAVEGKW